MEQFIIDQPHATCGVVPVVRAGTLICDTGKTTSDIVYVVQSASPELFERLFVLAKRACQGTIITASTNAHPHGQQQQQQQQHKIFLYISIFLWSLAAEHTNQPINKLLSRLKLIVDAAERRIDTKNENWTAIYVNNLSGGVHATLDQDGVTIFTKRAETIEKLHGTSTCGRRQYTNAQQRQLTCCPSTCITTETLSTLYVPDGNNKRQLDAYMQRRVDNTQREERIAHTLRPQGASISTVIGAGFFGGFQSDRRKKKKQTDIKDGAMHMALSALPPEVARAFWVGNSAARDIAKPLCDALSTEACMDEIGSGASTTTTTTTSSSSSANMQTDNHQKVTHPTTAATIATDDTSWMPCITRKRLNNNITVTAPMHEKIFLQQSTMWNDVAWMRKLGSVKACGVMPCGCIADIIIHAVTSARCAMAIEMANIGTHMYVDDMHAVASFLVDAAFGTFTKSTVTDPMFIDFVWRMRGVLIPAVSRMTTRIQRHTNDDVVGTRLARAISVVRTNVNPHPTKQLWYIAPCSRIHSYTDAQAIVIKDGAFWRAEEFMACCATGRREVQYISLASKNANAAPHPPPAKKLAFKKKCNVTSTSPSVGVAFARDGTTWPCDVAWGASIAVSTLGSSIPAACGHALPLNGRACVLGFGGDIGSDEREHCVPQCRCYADPSDAYVTGAMIALLKHGRLTGCELVYPFVTLVISHSAEAHVRDDRHWQAVDRTATTTRQMSGWTLLLRAALYWIINDGDDNNNNNTNEEDEKRYQTVAELLRVAARSSMFKSMSVSRIQSGLVNVIDAHAPWYIEDDACVILCELISRSTNATENNTTTTTTTTSPHNNDISLLSKSTNPGVTTIAKNARKSIINICCTIPDAAAMLLSNILCNSDTTTPTHVVVRGSLTSHESVKAHLATVTNLGEVSMPPGLRRGQCGEMHMRPAVGETAVPALALLCEEHIRGCCGDACEQLFHFTRTLEITRLKGARAFTAHPSCPSIQVFNDKCEHAWRTRSVVLCELTCTHELLCSAEALPVADAPHTLPGANSILCHRCGHTHDNTEYTTAEANEILSCMPPKDGPLMAELVHARHGLPVLSHALPQKTPQSAYPISLVKMGIALHRDATDSHTRILPQPPRAVVPHQRATMHVDIPVHDSCTPTIVSPQPQTPTTLCAPNWLKRALGGIDPGETLMNIRSSLHNEHTCSSR